MDNNEMSDEAARALAEVNDGIRENRYRIVLEDAKNEFRELEPERARVIRRMGQLRIAILGLSELLDIPVAEEFQWPEMPLSHMPDVEHTNYSKEVQGK